jgi:hypothetical protein
LDCCLARCVLPSISSSSSSLIAFSVVVVASGYAAGAAWWSTSPCWRSGGLLCPHRVLVQLRGVPRPAGGAVVLFALTVLLVPLLGVREEPRTCCDLLLQVLVLCFTRHAQRSSVLQTPKPKASSQLLLSITEKKPFLQLGPLPKHPPFHFGRHAHRSSVLQTPKPKASSQFLLPITEKKHCLQLGPLPKQPPFHFGRHAQCFFQQE